MLRYTVKHHSSFAYIYTQISYTMSQDIVYWTMKNGEKIHGAIEPIREMLQFLLKCKLSE